MKRPMIFINGLSQQQIDYLKTLSEYQYIENFSKISENTQVYTHRDGTLKVVNSIAVQPEEEIQCKTYDEFLTCWSEYKLWLLLET